METTAQSPEALDEAARVHLEPGFAWDGQDAYLFDIDGTLLRNRDRVHRESFAVGVERVTGVDLEPYLYLTPGGTDPVILREAFVKAGLDEQILEEQWEAIVEAIHDACQERRSTMEIRIMPGVEAVLAHLEARGAVLAVATGNLEAIGWIKLEETSLRRWFQLGGFSDGFSNRAELVNDAARRARAIAGMEAQVCVVGDTPRDIEAAHANSLPCIAVATGRFSFDELLGLRPEACATTLAALLEQAQVAP